VIFDKPIDVPASQDPLLMSIAKNSSAVEPLSREKTLLIALQKVFPQEYVMLLLLSYPSFRHTKP
jgi:hypothetical protein